MVWKGGWNEDNLWEELFWSTTITANHRDDTTDAWREWGYQFDQPLPTSGEG